MTGLCATVGNFAGIFLLLAAIAALFETALLVIAKWGALKKAPAAPADVAAAADLEGLAKVLTALKDLPAWVALFLAGLALVWTATAAPKLCLNDRASAAEAAPAGN